MARIEDLPDTPSGLITMLKPGDFHGVVEWEVVKGRMLSFKVHEHKNCEVYETKFSRNTEVLWHTHGEFSKEIIVVEEGELTVYFEDGSQVTLVEAEEIVINKKVKHMAIISNKPCLIIAMTIPKEV